MNTLRLFFAVLPPKIEHVSLASLLSTLKHVFPPHSMKWIDVGNLHITLQFISRVHRNHLPLLIHNAHKVLKDTPVFQLTLGRVEWFPALDNPKILSLTVAPQELLSTLSASLGNSIRLLDYPVETRPFRGHMSLAMSRRGQHIPYGLINELIIPTIPPARIDKVYLIESKANFKGGRSYHIVAEFDLIK